MEIKIQVGMGSFEFMVNARRAIFYTFLTLFMVEVLGADFIQIGLVITLPMLANSAMQAFVWGRVSDKIKKRRLLVVVGETAAGIGYLLIWTNITNWTIIIGLTIIEAIWSMSNTGWSALFADLTEPDVRSTLMGRINAVGIIGRIFGVTVIGLLYDYPFPGAGFFWVFPIAAGIMFGSVLALIATVPEVQQAIASDFPESSLPQRNTNPSWRDKYPKNFLIFLGVWAFITIGWISYLSLFTIYLRVGLNLNSLEISLVRNVNSAVGLIAAPVAGVLGDRLGRKPVIIGTLIIQAITSVFYGFVNSLLGMLLVNGINGVVRPTVFTLGYALAADMIPETRRGELFGLYNSVWTISFGSSPTAVGGVYATWRLNDYLSSGFPPEFAATQAIIDTFFLSAGLVLIGTFLFGLVIKEPTHKEGENLATLEEEPVAVMDTLD
ncbi:MAG: MFS transporter [Promethearchaeota archaeon]